MGGCWLEDIQCPVYLDHQRLQFHDNPDLKVGGVIYLSNCILFKIKHNYVLEITIKIANLSGLGMMEMMEF